MRDALLRCLAHLGMVETDIAPAQEGSKPPSLFDVSPSGMTLRASADGVFVPSVNLRQRVTVGQVLGQYSEPTEPDRPIISIIAPHDGVVVCQRAIARSEPGDCLFQIAPERAFRPCLNCSDYANESLSHRIAMYPLRYYPSTCRLS